jgi:hypothetical protein
MVDEQGFSDLVTNGEESVDNSKSHHDTRWGNISVLSRSIVRRNGCAIHNGLY